MTVSITPESKNSLNVTNEVKVVAATAWDDPTVHWDDPVVFWDAQAGVVIGKESKNSVSINNEAKN